jgi:hypothetical protein
VLSGVVLAGDAVVMIDNITRTFGHAMLDMILTAEGPISFRKLGKTGNAVCFVPTVFLATGNNILLRDDLPRRTIHIRLISSFENPERRTAFCHPDLISHIRQNHAKLWIRVGWPRRCTFELWLVCGTGHTANRTPGVRGDCDCRSRTRGDVEIGEEEEH